MDTATLASIVDPESTTYGLTATGREDGDVRFINIENLRPDATIDLRGVRYVMDDGDGPKEKHLTNLDDILISRSRLPGIAAVVAEEAARVAYGSYIIRFHLSNEGRANFLPEYVALFC